MKPTATPLSQWPLHKRLMLPFQARLRRDHRLFRSFPDCPYETFLDVGAYEGEFTESLLAYFTPQHVWLVEADPEQAAALPRHPGSGDRPFWHGGVSGERAPAFEFARAYRRSNREDF